MSQIEGTAAPQRRLRDRVLESFLMPRPWHGMSLPVWLHLLARNRFAVSPGRLPMALVITGCSATNSMLGLWESLRYGRCIKESALERPPLFLLGHWRSGTTLLHELISEDPQFTTPTVYQTMAPQHFLTTGRLLPPLVSRFMPSKRPMDDVSLGLDRPMEDEFALCNLGSPSPYLSWAWPNRFACTAFMDLHEFTDREKDLWNQHLLDFLKRLQIDRPGRMLLKSPPHTARVSQLIELFPDAQFIHITRHPHRVFPSSMKTWMRMQALSGLHRATYEGLETQVLEGLPRMYERFERDRASVSPENLCDLRYEDLVENPEQEICRIYEHLGLGDFQVVQPRIQRYLDERSGYRSGRYELPAALKQRIADCWGPYMKKYGYSFNGDEDVPATETQQHHSI